MPHVGFHPEGVICMGGIIICCGMGIDMGPVAPIMPIPCIGIDMKPSS